MKKTKSIALILGVLVMSLVISYFAIAWQEPTVPPPQEQVPAPINVGSVTQTKAGGLNILGNVGIGTPSPGARLDIGNAGSLFLSGHTTHSARIELGEGRTSDGYAYIDLHGDATYADYGLRLLRGNTGLNTWSDLVHRGTGELRIRAVEAAPLSLWTSNTRRIYITSGGNVGIGTTGPRAKLNVDRGIALGTGAGVSETHGGRRSLQILSDTSYGGIHDNHSGFLTYSTMPGGWGTARLHFARSTGWGAYDTTTPTLSLSGTNVGIGIIDPGTYRLRVNGSVAATAFYYTSDINLKTNIEPLSNSLEKILKLQGVSFDWKDSNDPSTGFIAQEVEKIFPEAVYGLEGEKTIDYAKLIAPMIEAIKEQQKEIEELKAIIQ